MLTKKRKSTLLTLSILMGLTSCTQASEVIQTPDVVVTATKTQQEVKAVPNAVEVITSEDIEQLGATDIYSALKLATNVDVSQIGAGHRLDHHGRAATDLHAAHMHGARQLARQRMG